MNGLDVFYAIYNSIYNLTFSFYDTNQKSLIQLMIFLHDTYMEENNYDFIVFDGKMFSQNLHNDLFESKNTEIILPELTDNQKKFVSFMKKILWAKPRVCSVYTWFLYISLIVYCKKHLNRKNEEIRDFIKSQIGESFDLKLYYLANKTIDTIFF